MKTRRNRARGAFTLIEVMIVILIVLALSGLVAYSLLGTKERATVDLCKIDMNTLKGALKQFRFEFNRYPTDEEGLKALWSKDAITNEDDQKKWHAFLESPLDKDKWGSDWGYRAAGEHGDDMYDLWSIGPDKQEGTDDDIVSWNKDAESGSNSAPPPKSGGKGGG